MQQIQPLPQQFHPVFVPLVSAGFAFQALLRPHVNAYNLTNANDFGNRGAVMSRSHIRCALVRCAGKNASYIPKQLNSFRCLGAIRWRCGLTDKHTRNQPTTKPNRGSNRVIKHGRLKSNQAHFDYYVLVLESDESFIWRSAHCTARVHGRTWVREGGGGSALGPGGQAPPNRG